jgi:hypothetical protein
MRRLSPALLAALLVPGLLLGACSRKETSAKDLREQLSTALQKGDEGLNEEQADCYATLVIDEVGAKKVNDLKITDKEPSKALATELAGVATKARTECGIG